MQAAPTHPPNRLARETSPYLLQHAHNPVDWYPWGDEAIASARRENRLIFLSIGYSTCYWCHVMERECFENEAIARRMNELFVCVKVDREERPDLDDIYMSAVQAMTGRGGWPMSVWLDPASLAPIVAGTYFPPEPRHGMRSFPEVMDLIDQAWRTRPEELRATALRIVQAMRAESVIGPATVAVGLDDVNAAANQLMRAFDVEHGGFGSAPKFPQPAYLQLLLACRDLMEGSSQRDIDDAIRLTLDRMAMGGMFDQVGGGFHRYSTDEKWLVPHFEKMLYDNGQLASVYARAFQVYRDPFHGRIARRTCEYVVREMRASEGAFFSAQDAEVDAREGLNYLWSPEQVREALRDAGMTDLEKLTLRIYGLDRGTNFRDPHHPGEPASNVLFLAERPEVLSREFGCSIDEMFASVDRVNESLLRIRSRRKQPGLDDKIIVSWNGLMIAGLADSGTALGEPRFVAAAADAARFILKHMRTNDGGLLRTCRNSESRIDAFLEDYALFALGLLALHRATSGKEWVQAAREIVAACTSRFADISGGGYFDTFADRPDLFVRTKSLHDGTMPCGNAAMVHVLLDLFEATDRTTYIEAASATLGAMSGVLHRSPVAAAVAVTGLLRMATRHADHLPQPSRRPEAVAQTSVSLTVDRDRISPAANGSATLTVMIAIPSGCHIYAHDPGEPGLLGLQITVAGDAGVAIDVSYPRGEILDGRLRGHAGMVRVPIALQNIGNASSLRLAVRFQACTETECLAPQTQVIAIEVD